VVVVVVVVVAVVAHRPEQRLRQRLLFPRSSRLRAASARRRPRWGPRRQL
jgi:hypothetical protein